VGSLPMRCVNGCRNPRIDGGGRDVEQKGAIGGPMARRLIGRSERWVAGVFVSLVEARRPALIAILVEQL
jgi:hypothetical protein